jgi:transcriptional regulator with XRE-family HTH domain
MTEIATPSIGQRIATYRKLLGFRSSQDLANAIPNAKITESVIQNIESGRKKDVSVAQLLDISKALGISPIFLLVRIGDPMGKVDLDNVGEDVAAMTSAQVDRWISESLPAASERANSLSTQLSRIRDMLAEVNEYRKLRTVDVTKYKKYEYETEDLAGNKITVTRDEADAHNFALASVSFDIDEDAKYLASTSVDLSWAQDVIDEIRGAKDYKPMVING